MSVPETPYTRGEMYLSAIADGDSGGIPERPYTRKEMYLDAIARGDSSGIPERPYTREEMYLDAIAKNGGGGGGGDITVESKSISDNGTYTAPTGKAYSPVTVSVPASAVDSGTKSITSNGNNQDVVGYAAVDVAVPNSYAAGDEGKVVSNGALVAQTAHAEVTSNGTIDTTLNDSVVVNVSGGGGGGGVSPKQVNFIDYDGTILYAYTAQEAQALESLPANPSHSGLTAQGWNWTLAQIKAQLTAMPDGPVWVGQMYVTQSGNTEIDCTFDNPDYLSPYLTIAINGSVSVDWGDNTDADTVTGTSLTSMKYVSHIYSDVGQYTITISVNSGTFAFYNNSYSKAAVLSVYGIDSTRRYNRAYANCVDSIRLGASVNIGSSAFSNCGALQSITIPSGVTSIESYAFAYCYALQSITIPSGVTSIGSSAFSNCGALQSITIPSGVTSIGSSAFSNCGALQSITIPSGVTSIGSSAFNTCYALQSITIPSDVTSIEISAFNTCYALQSITIPSDVTSIGNYAFQNCGALRSITIPSGVTSIGNSAFAYCYGTEEYHIKPTSVPTGGTSMFNGIVSDTVIYVPAASLNSYKTATQWSAYASYMQGE